MGTAMLFTSFEFIFAFLPVVFGVYFLLNRFGYERASKIWLVFCSLFYYSWWKPIYLPLIVLSILINFYIGTSLLKSTWLSARLSQRAILVVGICFNVGLLGFFKYTDFFIANINSLLGLNLDLLKLMLPLGISFFTFLQISFLVDSYKGISKEYDLLNYSLFVSFFPELLSGPIVHHKEIIPQFDDPAKRVVIAENVARALFIFSIGLFKKVVIADRLAQWANVGFDHAAVLNFFEAWFVSLSYTFQIYFDFSGYTDMAIGAALLFNIKLPLNFDSPYKSTNPQEFWQRWHMTLSRFLRDYIYIPLGGNRRGEYRQSVNIMITFVVSGIWHGAGWTYIMWGATWGLSLIVHRLWKRTGWNINRSVNAVLFFLFFNATWILFRGRSFGDIVKVFKGQLGFNGVVLPESWAAIGPLKGMGLTFGPWLGNIGADKQYLLYLIAASAIICFCFRNSNELSERLTPSWRWALFTALLLGVSLVHLSQVTEFLYFNF